MTNPSYTDEQVQAQIQWFRSAGDWNLENMLSSLLADRQRLQAEMKAKDAKLERALRAIEHAEAVMSYCSGDAWERECTEKDRDAFDELYAELFPPATPQKIEIHPVFAYHNPPKPRTKCPICGFGFRGEIGVRDHMRAVHPEAIDAARVTPNETKETGHGDDA